ncbi:hypothetical protein EG329_012629 [Mollisiaceae sp. DMI_Dod_QoI]|nr:hypothetical protein EG329_012629 [Helotiales sp. DMI_Dod_QoI]
MAKENIQLSFAEKWGVFWVFGALHPAFSLGYTVLRQLLFPPNDSPGLGRSIATTFLKAVSSLSMRQTNGVLPTSSTSKVVEKYCVQNKLKHEFDALPHDAKLHWIGLRPAKGGNVILYFYGGGYNIAADPNHIVFGSKCASKANATLAILEYTLAPTAHFPTQLIQATEGLKHILTITSPSKVIIAGDSAGAHLTLSLLSHIIHPSRDIEPFLLSESLRGVCAMCPIVSFNYGRNRSYEYNADRDYLSLRKMKEMMENFKPPGLTDEEALKDPRLSPLDAPKGWWENCPVERIMLTMGEWEVFLDDCKLFGKRLEDEAAPKTKIELVLGRKEVHGACIMDTFLGLEDGDSTKAVFAWMGN